MTNEPFPQTPTACCVCAGAHHPWDCELARRFVSEVTTGTITPHDADEHRRVAEREMLVDEAAHLLRPLVHAIDAQDRREIARLSAEGRARIRAGGERRSREMRRAASRAAQR